MLYMSTLRDVVLGKMSSTEFLIFLHGKEQIEKFNFLEIQVLVYRYRKVGSKIMFIITVFVLFH